MGKRRCDGGGEFWSIFVYCFGVWAGEGDREPTGVRRARCGETDGVGMTHAPPVGGSCLEAKSEGVESNATRPTRQL